MEEKIINKTEGQNSFEFGKASGRMKLYFNDHAHLKEQIDGLKTLGFIDEEGNPKVSLKSNE